MTGVEPVGYTISFSGSFTTHQVCDIGKSAYAYVNTDCSVVHTFIISCPPTIIIAHRRAVVKRDKHKILSIFQLLAFPYLIGAVAVILGFLEQVLKLVAMRDSHFFYKPLITLYQSPIPFYTLCLCLIFEIAVP